GRAKSSYGLDSIPGFRQMRLQKGAADMLKLENPFFQCHDGLAGATSSINGREVLNFASYNYLGLNGHPEVKAAAEAAVQRYGTSASASRLVAGERPIHRELEKALADHRVLYPVEVSECFFQFPVDGAA